MEIFPKNHKEEENHNKQIIDDKEQKEYSTYNCEISMAIPHWPYSQPETCDIQKVYPIRDDIFVDESYPSETKSTIFSDKCCCEKFLDTYLCDQKCIWHGMPP